ncbi:hypothetical protein HZA85_03055 [Candidatus Uhrbacteria bacterium]|nr:hypothetical protein [Candidatus Uhrbacteria bacterium]
MITSSKSSVAKDVFAYLLTFVMLYIGVIDLISLLWNVIGVQFPDPASGNWMNPYDPMRNALASLIIVWPVFLLMTRYLVRDLKRHPEKGDLWVRRWLTYLTVFVAAMTIIVDLITLLNSFLGGELTTRFVLKVLVVLAVAACVLGYEFWELKRKPEEGKRQFGLMAGASIVLILASIVAGFVFVGTPKTARQEKLDAQRVSDLQSIQSQLVTYWNQKNILPESLDALRDPISGFVVPVDPVTREVYGYEKTGGLAFNLCATFDRPTAKWQKGQTAATPVFDPYGNRMSDDWNHESGQACFSRTIDPLLNKIPVKK